MKRMIVQMTPLLAKEVSITKWSLIMNGEFLLETLVKYKNFERVPLGKESWKHRNLFECSIVKEISYLKRKTGRFKKAWCFFEKRIRWWANWILIFWWIFHEFFEFIRTDNSLRKVFLERESSIRCSWTAGAQVAARLAGSFPCKATHGANFANFDGVEMCLNMKIYFNARKTQICVEERVRLMCMVGIVST